MTGVNKVILIGTLGRDPEVRYLENGSVVANFSIATTEKYKDRNGNAVENTEWHDLELWDGLAKVSEQYLKKGNHIYVEGKIKKDVWQNEQGENRSKTKIRVTQMNMLGGTTQNNNPSHQSNDVVSEAQVVEVESDDLPF